jgi:hypothetical protein
MAEVGCLKDGHFQNLQVESTTIFETGNITISGANNLVTVPGKFGAAGIRSGFFDLKTAYIISSLKSDNTIAVGSQPAGIINQHVFDNGLIIYSRNNGTQTLFRPIGVGNGFDISGDQTDGEGMQHVITPNESITAELPLGISSLNGSFTVGTSPAFFMRAVIEITDAEAANSGAAECAVGFRKVEDFQANLDDYDELACFNVLLGDVKTETILNGGSTVTTDLTTPASGDFADGAIWAYELAVSSTGVVTYKAGVLTSATDRACVLAPPTGVAAYTFDAGEVVTPFIFTLQAPDLTPIILHKLEFGLQ